MDALVAEKVFDRCRYCLNTAHLHDGYDGPGAVIGDEGDVDPITGETQWYCGRHNKRGWATPIPPYSTDIAAAWEVFESMTQRGFIPAIAQCTSGWACDFWKETEAAGPNGRVDYIHEFRTYGQDSAPLAICRAALKAADHDT
jgi:hypothetical protein